MKIGVLVLGGRTEDGAALIALRWQAKDPNAELPASLDAYNSRWGAVR